MRTLGFYRDFIVRIMGEDSPAVKYLDDKIAQSPGGRDELVLADDRQMLQLLVALHRERPFQ
jgi:hypothetical protein